VNKFFRWLKIILLTAMVVSALLAVGLWCFWQEAQVSLSRAVWVAGKPNLMDEGVIDKWRGVPVYYNGVPYTHSWGLHYADDGYYYGQKWQCVEFMKRFYHDRMHHAFPDVMGHAAEFFDANTAQGALNVKRGLLQFANGGNVKPALDDIMVWTSHTYGHVAIVAKVGDDFIEVVQQNVGNGSRGRIELSVRDGKYSVGDYGSLGAPAGWLRVKR
jgi:hypothetical protein